MNSTGDIRPYATYNVNQLFAQNKQIILHTDVLCIIILIAICFVMSIAICNNRGCIYVHHAACSVISRCTLACSLGSEAKCLQR